MYKMFIPDSFKSLKPEELKYQKELVMEDHFGNWDAIEDPSRIVAISLETIALLVGDAPAEAAANVILTEMYGKSYNPTHFEDWREALHSTRDPLGSIGQEWPKKERLEAIYEYAYYGQMPKYPQPNDLAEAKAITHENIMWLYKLQAFVPFEYWRDNLSVVFEKFGQPKVLAKTDIKMGEELYGVFQGDLYEAAMLAINRWELDNDRPISVEALALFGDVTIGRMRNMISGKNPELKRTDDGKIPAAIALDWLSNRESFFATEWKLRTDGDPVSEEVISLTKATEYCFVPVARDGTYFSPKLVRNGEFQIGKKGAEEQYDVFEQALAALQKLPVPYWRRPSAGSGAWGIVSGHEWKRMSKQELDGENETISET